MVVEFVGLGQESLHVVVVQVALVLDHHHDAALVRIVLPDCLRAVEHAEGPDDGHPLLVHLRAELSGPTVQPLCEDVSFGAVRFGYFLPDVLDGQAHEILNPEGQTMANHFLDQLHALGQLLLLLCLSYLEGERIQDGPEKLQDQKFNMQLLVSRKRRVIGYQLPVLFCQVALQVLQVNLLRPLYLILLVSIYCLYLVLFGVEAQLFFLNTSIDLLKEIQWKLRAWPIHIMRQFPELLKGHFLNHLGVVQIGL